MISKKTLSTNILIDRNIRVRKRIFMLLKTTSFTMFSDIQEYIVTSLSKYIRTHVHIFIDLLIYLKERSQRE